jgi:hypothetical protein
MRTKLLSLSASLPEGRISIERLGSKKEDIIKDCRKW